MLKLQRILLLILSATLFLPIFQLSVGAVAPSAKVIITEVKLGGGDDVIFADSSKAKDFVTLYNQSSEPVSLDGWSLQYAKAGAGFADCNAQFAAGNITQLSGTLLPGTISLPIKRSMNDATDGALRLIDTGGVINDLIGWGVTTKCYDGSPSSTPANGKSLQRYLDCDTNLPVDTDNNSADFALSDIPSPGVLAGPLTADCAPPPPPEDPGDDDNPGSEDTTSGQGTGPASSCGGVIISELLPNPAGSDAGHELIELFNPTGHDISLAGCKLQTTANSKLFAFTDEEMAAGQYKAFYNDTTGLTLANSGGGSVFLIDTDNSEIDQADYAADLDDDVSWSLINGDWRQTFTITPETANELLELKPCPAGQMRNPDTNRCINIVTAAVGLGPCAPGKERNPDTHRCRNIASLASVLKACAADQFRNPATNRCKKVSSSSLAPCKAGQERNPATNRCKKTLAGSSYADGNINDVKDVLSSSSPVDRSSWAMAGISVLGAMLYAAWEWRSEITQQLGILRSKFSV